MKFPRLIHDPVEVDEILKDRAWGMSMPALVPLLGDGVIMATGSHHTALRRQIGHMPHMLDGLDLHAIVRDFEPPRKAPATWASRPVGLITQRLAKVVGVMTRTDG
mgnify:CR=1 FL=1